MATTTPAKKRARASSQRFFIGGFCGLVEITVTYPLEFIKNSMQLQPKRFRTPLEALRVNVANHGARVLYRGIPSWWLFAFPRSAVRFTGFDVLTHQLDSIEHDLLRDAMAGVGAGVLEAYCALIPCQNLSIRMTHDANLPSGQQKFGPLGFFRGMTAITNDIGWRGMFSGSAPTVLKNSLNMMIRFPGFHYLSAVRLASKSSSTATTATTHEPVASLPVTTLSALELMVCGGVAGAVSSVVTHPVDVVKANMMGLHSQKFGNPLQASQIIFQKNGWRGFYVGLSPRISRVFIEVGMLFTIFEKITEMFHHGLSRE